MEFGILEPNDKAWLIHYKDVKSNNWIDDYASTLTVARIKVNALERELGVSSIYIQHIDGEVDYHRQDGVVQFGDWRFEDPNLYELKKVI
jgi:hypothetical protein